MRATTVIAATFFASCLFPLLGCSSAASGATSSSTAPLLGACTGSFTCAQDGSSNTTPTTLTQGSDGTCHAGTLTLTDTEDADAGDNEKTVIDESGSVVATWNGDSASFELCSSDGCLTCTNDAVKADAGSSSSSSTSSGTCTGVTLCSSFGSYACSSHDGCSYDSFGNDCDGITPDCSSWATKSDCEHQDCTWKQ